MVLLAVFMMVFTIVSVNTFDRNDRDIFGYRCYIVLSDSMSATDFSAGDLVIVKKVDPTTLQEGDIISYQSQNMENYGATVTHKIRAKTRDGGGRPRHPVPLGALGAARGHSGRGRRNLHSGDR